MVPARAQQKVPFISLFPMDRDGGRPSYPLDEKAVYPEVLPGGFINPFSVPPADAQQRAQASAAVPQPAMPSSASIQQLSASLHTHHLQQLQQQQHRVLHRQSFDISMLPQMPPPTQPPGLQFQHRPPHLPFRNEIFGMVPSQNSSLSSMPLQQRQSEFDIDAAFPHMSSGLHQNGNMPATTTPAGLSHAGSTNTSLSMNSPSQASTKSSSATGVNPPGPPDIALLLSGAAQLKTHTAGKPPYSYATLITYALLHHPRKQMTLNEIYNWAMDNYPYFKSAGSGWKNSIRHNLSLNKTFVRIPRPANEPGKGAYWTVDLAVLDSTMNNAGKPPPMHRYSLPRDGQLEALGGMPMHMSSGNGPAFVAPLQPQLPTQPPLSFTSPGIRQSELATINPFLMSVTSSISEMGANHQMPHGHGAFALRRASLQVLPSNRYQPYPATPMGAPGGRVTPMGDGVAETTTKFDAPNSLSGLNPFATSTATAPSAVESSMQSFESFLQAERPKSARPPPLSNGPEGYTNSANNSQSLHLEPVAPTPADISGTNARDSGYNALANESILMSLKTRLQVKPTSSLPSHLLTSQQANNLGGATVHKQMSESLEDIGNNDGPPTIGPHSATALQPVGDVDRNQAQNIAYGAPMSNGSASSGLANMGDISTYFTFSDAHEPPT
ncbi:hypothetical protein GGH13_007601 [Coemansia sp. S155-1]|nr:hypothetical protein GGH13_007601 [Coemansia sp. S155-1]